MAKEASKKYNRPEEKTPPDVFYMGQIWRVIGKKEGTQGEPWLHLKRGFFTAMVKQYEVKQTYN
ncbi:MAG: hypothetical protein GF334_05695 [Candidatus Altiarchaeales archaeon]|nr:hypothetical protein [Candidatus Altiarchaeales archaeon]